MQNIQELQTIAGQGIPAKIFLYNNAGYHSIRQAQEAHFNGFSVGCGPESGVTFPDFERIAHAFGIGFVRTSTHADMADAVRRTLDTPGPCLCEIMVDKGQAFAPKASSRRLPDGTMVTAPLEDLAPFLSREELAENMLAPSPALTRTTPPDAVLFDLDGTLVDTAPTVAVALSKIRRTRGADDIAAEDVRPLISLGALELVERALGPVRRDATGDLAEFRNVLSSVPTDPTQLYQGARELIAELRHASVSMAIVTNKPEALSRKLVADLGLLAAFTAVVGGDSAALPKPDPGPILLAMAKLGIPRERTIFVGDSLIDAQAAQAARLPFHLFLGGYGAPTALVPPSLDFRDLRRVHEHSADGVRIQPSMRSLLRRPRTDKHAKSHSI